MHTQRFNQWEDFTKTVLNFSFAELELPLSVARRQSPLPVREHEIEIYYSNFLPFILEEARAILAEGLEKVNSYLCTQNQHRHHQRNPNVQHLLEAKPFQLVLQKQAVLPRTPGNPLCLHFKGSIPHGIEHGKSMNALLLKMPARRGLSEQQWLALASENLNGTEIYAKIVISADDYNVFKAQFKKDARWQAHYLGSVISEQRMFDHCLMQVDNRCIQQIINAYIPNPNTKPVAYLNEKVNHLNQSQKETLYAFFNAQEGSVLLLQGPPGTGKTTTLVNLLKCITDQSKRILVSAHSNKGVQVLALRAYRELSTVPMILIGVESKIPDELKPISLNRWYDNIAECLAAEYKSVERMVKSNGTSAEQAAPDLSQKLTKNFAAARAMLDKFNLLYYRRLDEDSRKEIIHVCGNDPITASDFEAVQVILDTLQQNNTPHQWQALFTKQTRLMEKWATIVKSTVEEYLLDYAEIIFATLITCGRDSIANMSSVDYLLVDEAAQSVEAATMIPMRFQPKKVLLVGDTKQLPATVISNYLDDRPAGHPDTHYRWSLMWRLIEENRQPSLMLDIQYRMHPHICWWPSEKYYNNQLITSPDILPMASLTTRGITSRPYTIYQVSGQETNKAFSHSISNEIEANYVSAIVGLIRQENPDKRIGVITPYAAQKALITQKINQKSLRHHLVDVNTVDGFQGDECDVVIISFTRTHVSTFLKEFRRLNVAITRPKHCLIILANPGLETHDIGELISNAKKRQIVFSEFELKKILRTKKLPAQALNTVADLSQQAWASNSQAQYAYYQTLLLQNQDTALVWLRRAAEHDHPLAQFDLSQYYQTGTQTLKKNVPLSIKWLQKSAENHCEQAQYALTKQFICDGAANIPAKIGIRWCHKAADNHEMGAIVFLAKCYASGQHISKDEEVAIIYYRRAAALNDISSIFALAKIFETRGSTAEAIQWYKILMQHGDSRAYYPLALLLAKTVDELHYLQLAADHGHIEAQCKLVKLFTNGNAFIPINLDEAARYAKKLADVGNQFGLIVFVELLQQNEKIEISDQERNRYYKIAADGGHIASQYYYARYIFNSNPRSAYLYFQMAAQKNYSDAYYYFAILEKQYSERTAYIYFTKSIAANKYLLASKKECVEYIIEHNTDLRLCLKFCEDLYNEDEKSLSFILARLLDTGLSGKIDRQKALNIYIELAEENHIMAMFFAGILLSNPGESFYNFNLARDFFTRIHQNIHEVKLRLACLLLEKSVDIDFAEVLLEEYCLSFKHTQTELFYHLDNKLEAIIKLNGIKSNYNIEEFNYHTPKISFYLGKIFEKGLGVSINIIRAFSYYASSANMGHPESAYRLAYCYEHGINIPKDWSRATLLYQKAADKGHELAQKRLTWQYALVSSFTDIDDTQLKNHNEACVIT